MGGVGGLGHSVRPPAVVVALKMLLMYLCLSKVPFFLSVLSLVKQLWKYVTCENE